MYALCLNSAFVFGLLFCALSLLSLSHQAHAQCANLGANLVVNGNFQSGNQFFATDYQLVTPGGCGNPSGSGLCPEFTYVVASNPNLYHQSFWCPCTTANATNTSNCTCLPSERICDPADLKMFVNGRTQQAVVWQQTINGLNIGTFYEFQAEVDNLIEGKKNLLDPYLRVTVDGVPLDTDLPLPECPDAPQIMRCYFQANTQSISLAVINLSTGASGNDFSVDNISLRGCGLTGVGVLSGCNLQVVLPVELLSFTAQPDGMNVQLNWRTASEQNNAGWALERGLSVDGPFAELAFVPGFGTTIGEQAYQYTDHNLAPATYFYRLRQIDFNGTQTLGPVMEATIAQENKIMCYAVKGELIIDNGDAANLLFFVSDMHGVMRYSATAFGKERTTVTLESGLYIVQVGTHAQKVLVP